MAIRLMGLDLDGTLLNEEKQLTPAVKQAVEQAAARGILPVPVTGRPLTGIPEEVMDLPGIRYVITSNGALCFSGKEVCFSAFLEQQVAERIAEMARELGDLYSVFADGIGWSDGKSHRALMEHFSNTPLSSYMARSRRPVAEWGQFQKDHGGRIENVWVRTPGKEAGDRLEEAIRQDFGSSVQTLRTLPADVETVSAMADKGTALLRLAQTLSIRREEIFAIGDSGNDVGLLRAAGTSVAMGNATKDAREAADHLTADNEHDGAALAIRRYALGEEETHEL